MSQILAGLVCCAYFCLGLVFVGWPAVARIALFIAIPLSCILYPETMAAIGSGNRPGPLPAGLVFQLGWFVLVLPAILAGVLWLML